MFFKKIVGDDHHGKVKYCAIRVEFQVRGSRHIYSSLWVLNSPVLIKDNIDEYIRFVDADVRACVPDRNENPQVLFL